MKTKKEISENCIVVRVSRFPTVNEISIGKQSNGFYYEKNQYGEVRSFDNKNIGTLIGEAKTKKEFVDIVWEEITKAEILEDMESLLKEGLLLCSSDNNFKEFAEVNGYKEDMCREVWEESKYHLESVFNEVNGY